MIIFLKRTILFLLLSFSIVFILVSLPNILLRNLANFKLEKNGKMIVLGHSYAECAYDDSIIFGIENLASSGESYFYTYQKIQTVIPYNPKIQTVFIEFSNNQIDVPMDEWIWGYEKMAHFLPIYLPFINFEDFELLLAKNPEDLLTCISLASRKSLYRLLTLDVNYSKDLGGYKLLENSLKELHTKDSIHQRSRLETNINISKANLDYLRKIIDFCHESSIDVYLIRSPQYKEITNFENELKFQEILKERFEDVEFLDFINFSMPLDHFADPNHLNYKGAQKLSIWFNDLIINGLLHTKNKKKFIEERM